MTLLILLKIIQRFTGQIEFLKGHIVVREATIEDLPFLMDIGQKFFEANEWPVELNFNPEFLEKTLIHLISDDNGVILRNDTGCIGGLLFPYYFTGDLTTQELFWWADKDGLELLEAFERWSKNYGAKTVSMITLAGLNPERVGKIYQRRGYTPVEHSYIKVI